MVIICLFVGMSATASLKSKNDDEIVIELRIPRGHSFLQCEELIQDSLNEAGKVATKTSLEDFDTDGSPIVVAGVKLSAKREKVSKKYQSPHGEFAVERYVYQGTAGGATEVPLECNARIIASSTPRWARVVSSKYSAGNAGAAARDIWESHRLEVSRCFIQDLSTAVAAQVRAKEQRWDTAREGAEPTVLDVATVAIGIDGTCMLFCGGDYRQAMVGTIAFSDAAGERLHTTYVAAAPEYGKATFLARMDTEIARVKRRYASARYVGVTDGATDFLPWLRGHTTTQVLDFWHVSEYINAAAAALHRGKAAREEWVDKTCHDLKHRHGAAAQILAEFEAARGRKMGASTRTALNAAISYFKNNLDRMNYASYGKSHIPIGSGVTEAACKVIVKQRMCGSGMKWKHSGADDVLTLRALERTDGAWEVFWRHIEKYGVSGQGLPASDN
jgi:hypothetical protein